ncbi:MAG: insulinase family protein [Candidatus Wildermuthbacteria bacterium]|nr:insulinase family protein [Candidatus Wildermuthbacteria bacterium]
MFKKTVLPNGLRIVTAPQSSTRAATVFVLVGTGSKYETKEINGISHFLEHMFFKGTKKRPSPMEVTEVLDTVGGMSNAFTSDEWTGYYAKVDAGHLDLALELISDIFLNSLLPAKEVQKEKGVIVEEINLYRDNPSMHIDDLWKELLYGDQPAGWNIVGTKESVASIMRADLLTYMKNQYVASNTVVCVAGNIDPEKTLKKIKDLFKSIPEADFKQKPKIAEIQQSPQVLLEHRPVDQTQIALGVRAFNLSDERRYAQDLLATSLGGMMSSRLFNEVREKLGLAYSIYSDSETNTDTGWLVSVAGVRNDRVEKAITTILKEYEKMKRVLVSPGELDKIKEHEIGRHILQVESSDARAQFYAMQELLEKKISTPEELYAKIRSVEAEDIRQIARAIFKPENLNLVVLGPFKDKKPFERLLNK